MPETYYLDTVVESWRSEAKRLEATVKAQRDVIRTLNRDLDIARRDLLDANNRLSRIRAGGKG